MGLYLVDVNRRWAKPMQIQELWSVNMYKWYYSIDCFAWNEI